LEGAESDATPATHQRNGKIADEGHPRVDDSYRPMKELIGIAGAAIALLTLLKGVFEYVLQGTQKRCDLFLAIHARFKDNAKFDEICCLLEEGDPHLADVSYADKNAFLSFFEEVALIVNSRLLKREVAHYMFGYYAIRCWESDDFWTGVNRQGLYWSLFRSFVEQMKAFDRTAPFDSSKYSF